MSSEVPQYKYVVQDMRRELWKAQLGDHRGPALSRKILGNFKTRLQAAQASFKACAKASSAPRRSYATALPALGSCDARARFMYHMLLEATHVMADIPPATMRLWYRGPGHLTSHHGFQVLLSASAGGERGSPPQGG